MSQIKKVSSVYIQLVTPGRINTPKTYNSVEASRADKRLPQNPVLTAPKPARNPYSYGNKGMKGTDPPAYNSADEDFPLPPPPPPAPEKAKDAFYSNEMPLPPPPLQACEEPVPSLTDSKQSRLLKSNVGTSPKQQEFSPPSKPARIDQKDSLTQIMNDKLNGLPDSGQDICAFCNRLIPPTIPVVEAMGKIFHEDCLKCRKCQCKLVGKIYYNLDDNPHCDSCYRDTVEKCEKCRKPIMDQITRAMDKAFHSECFRCVVCNRLIGSERFGLNQDKEIYCLEDFQRRYAPQCSVCEKPIIPETAKEECVNIELFGRHFHVNCYRCEVRSYIQTKILGEQKAHDYYFTALLEVDIFVANRPWAKLPNSYCSRLNSLTLSSSQVRGDVLSLPPLFTHIFSCSQQNLFTKDIILPNQMNLCFKGSQFNQTFLS